MGYENWTQAVEGWIEEKQLYYYGYPSTGVVGHYTQVGNQTISALPPGSSFRWFGIRLFSSVVVQPSAHRMVSTFIHGPITSVTTLPGTLIDRSKDQCESTHFVLDNWIATFILLISKRMKIVHCMVMPSSLPSSSMPTASLFPCLCSIEDCSGKVCLYNGTLDLNTCQCQCSSYASGDQCEYCKWLWSISDRMCSFSELWKVTALLLSCISMRCC